MIADLVAIKEQLLLMRQQLQRDATLPNPDEALAITTELNNVRSALIALDQLLHARHNARHPTQRVAPDTTPTQPLDAVTRAEIDAMP